MHTACHGWALSFSSASPSFSRLAEGLSAINIKIQSASGLTNSDLSAINTDKKYLSEFRWINIAPLRSSCLCPGRNSGWHWLWKNLKKYCENVNNGKNVIPLAERARYSHFQSFIFTAVVLSQSSASVHHGLVRWCPAMPFVFSTSTNIKVTTFGGSANKRRERKYRPLT